MCSFEITELISLYNVDFLITKFEKDTTNWKTISINDTYDKIAILIILYIRNNQLSNAINLMNEFCTIYFNNPILDKNEHKIKLLMLCSFVQSLVKSKTDINIITIYLQELINLNKEVNNKQVTYYISKSTALIHYVKKEYIECKEIFLQMTNDYKSDNKLLYDIYICLIELYTRISESTLKHTYICKAIPIIFEIYDMYHTQIYSLLYFIGEFISTYDAINSLRLCNIADQILEDAYSMKEESIESDMYFYKIGIKKMEIHVINEQYMDILLNIDKLISCSLIDKVSNIKLMQIKITASFKCNKIRECLRLYSEIEHNIKTYIGPLSDDLIRFYVFKLSLCCKICDEKMYISTLNKVCSTQLLMKNTTMVLFNKIHIIKPNIQRLICEFKEIVNETYQECVCGKVNLTTTPYTLCKQCKMVFFCSKSCKQKYKKKHSKVCTTILI